MSFNLPHSINGDNDLRLYEEYLKKDSSFIAKSKPQPYGQTQKVDKTSLDFKSFLKAHIGEIIKVEFPVGPRLDHKIGKLKFVGNDYLELTQNGGNIIAILLALVTSVGVIGTFNK